MGPSKTIHFSDEELDKILERIPGPISHPIMSFLAIAQW